MLANGPGGINDLHDPKAGEKQWGNLPPKLREQILQSKTDGFPPGYEALLQSYYRRLATEQVSGGDDKQPTTAPAAVCRTGVIDRVLHPVEPPAVRLTVAGQF